MGTRRIIKNNTPEKKSIFLIQPEMLNKMRLKLICSAQNGWESGWI